MFKELEFSGLYTVIVPMIETIIFTVPIVSFIALLILQTHGENHILVKTQIDRSCDSRPDGDVCPPF